jgi:hypothetical protein
MTNSEGYRDSPVMMSSAMPSAKNSCSGSPLMLVKGNTATDGLSGSASDGVVAYFAASAAAFRRFVEARGGLEKSEAVSGSACSLRIAGRTRISRLNW